MRRIILTTLILVLIYTKSNAQFNMGELGGGNQGGVPTQTSQVNDSISAANSFSFKKYFSALGHKGDTLTMTHMFMGSLLLPGSAQIYNEDYWKLPVIYAGIGAMAYGAYHYNSRYQITDNPDFQKNRNIFIAGAAFIYWASLMDGVFSYKSTINPLPARSSLYSALLPGLGQAHNGDYWKIPIFYAGLTTTGYLWYYNGIQYERYKLLYRQASNPNGGYTGNQSAENLKHLRDSFRRYRDYSIIATVLIYVLQVVDADVFATMSDFDVSDDLSLKIEPAIIQPIMPINNYNYTSTINSSIGLQLIFKF